MNAAHVHLVLNHAPIFGLPLAVLLLVYGLVRREPIYGRLALVLLLLLAALTIPIYFTGEGAEEILERTRPVVSGWIEAHEEAALVSFIGMELIGALSAFALWRARRTGVVGTRLLVATLVASVMVTASTTWTAYLGGHIAHPETQAVTAGVEP